MFFIQKTTWFRRQIWIWGNIIYGVGHSPAKLGPRPAPQRFLVFSRTRRSRKKTCPGIASCHAWKNVIYGLSHFSAKLGPRPAPQRFFAFSRTHRRRKKNMSRQKTIGKFKNLGKSVTNCKRPDPVTRITRFPRDTVILGPLGSSRPGKHPASWRKASSKPQSQKRDMRQLDAAHAAQAE